MASLFSDAQIAELHKGKEDVNRTFTDLHERYLSRSYRDAHAEEHALRGFRAASAH